jgi:hypothetical protein
LPQADLFGEHPVALRPLYQRREAAFRQLGGMVVGNVADHLGVAAPHQHVGDGFPDPVAAGDCIKVGLALGLGDVDEVGLFQSGGFREHRAGDRDVVIVGELPHQLQRRIGDRGETQRDFGARLGLDFEDELAQHVVEQADVVFVESLGAVDEQIGDLFEHLRALFVRAVLNDVFELGNQRRGCCGHHKNPTGRGPARGYGPEVKSAS